MSEKIKKQMQDQITMKVVGALQELFNQDSEHYIPQEELEREEMLTYFFHALANLAPVYYYIQLTGDKVNALGFNHIANKLAF